MHTPVIQLIGIDLETFKSIINQTIIKILKDNESVFTKSETYADEFLSRKEAAEFLKISKTTLWNLDKTQVLPALRLNGKVLYRKSSLLNFQNETN